MWYLTLLFGTVLSDKLFGDGSGKFFDIGNWFDKLLGKTKSEANPNTTTPTPVVVSLTTDDIIALTTTQVQALTTAQIAALNTEQVQAFTTTAIGAFLTNQLAALTTTNVGALTSDQVVALTTLQVPALPTSSVAALTTDQIQVLETVDLATLTTSQIQALTSDQIVALTTDQFPAITTRDIAALTTNQILALETQDLAVLTTSQIRALSTEDISVFSSSQVYALTSSQFSALTSSQLAALPPLPLNIPVLSTTQIAALTTAQILALSTDQIVALRTDQAAALSTSAIQVLTSSQVMALETEDLVALTTIQIAAFSSNQTAVLSTIQVEAFTSEQIPAFTLPAYQYLTTGTPIILDLNGDGVSTQSIDAGVKFDLFGDGAAISTGWVSGSDGLLVLDRNHDGQINDGSELFGSATRLSNGEKAPDGYTALGELDTNHDGVISSDDAAYNDLKVWVDSNSDGLSDVGEIKTLASLGISKINLNATAGTEINNGNLLGLTSTYETTDGATHAAADVWFLANRTPTAATAQSVDSAIAALGAETAQPVTVPAVTAETNPAQPGLGIEVPAQVVANSGPATDNLRTQVSNMAQAMGTFVETGAVQAGNQVLQLDSGAQTPGLPKSDVALAVASMADAMKQFDSNGNMLGSPSLAVPTLNQLKLNTTQDPSKSAILVVSNGR